MKPGDKLYRVSCDDGVETLETVTFIGDALPLHGSPSFIRILDGGRKCRCSREMYVESAYEAWKQYRFELVMAVQDADKRYAELRQEIMDLERSIDHAADRMEECQYRTEI